MAENGIMPVMNVGGNDGYSGFGGGSGAWIAILALLFCGGGFNRGGYNDYDYNRGDHQCGQIMDTVRDGNAVTQGQIGELSIDLYQRQIFDKICETERLIDSASAANLAATADAKYDNALLLKDMALENAKCCCQTQAAIKASEVAILSRIDAFENQNLRDKVNALELAQSQCSQNAYLVNQLRPCPIPAYPSCNPWGGNGCGCGNGGFGI